MKRSPIKALLLCGVAASAFLPPPCAAAPSPAEEEVTETVRSMFAAFAADDLPRFHAVTAPEFFAFDVGKRFDGEALMNLIKEAHAKGTLFVWKVTEPTVHVQGDVAWTTYVNDGSIQDPSGTKKMTWLESAILHKDEGVWRIQFLHSTRSSS
ncbi:MAG: DUF4440 domain-containing protein [Chthoniobacterales bacterium]